MTSYRAVLRLSPGYHFAPSAVLDSQAFGNALAGVVAQKISTDQWAELVLDITLKRPSHEAALNDLFALAQQFGYVLLNGEISKFVGSEVEGAILTGLGGGLLGATLNNGLVALLAAAAGGLVGGLVGSSMKRVETIYEVRPNASGGWTFSPRAEPGEAQPGVAWS